MFDLGTLNILATTVSFDATRLSIGGGGRSSPFR